MTARQTLRDTVRAALTTALPGIDWRGRWWDSVTLPASGTPVGAIITPTTRTAFDAVGHVTRTVQLLVMVKATGGADLPDVLDTQAAAIEVAVLGALAPLSTLYGLTEERLDVTGDVKTPVGEMVLTFEVVLRTAEATQTIII